MKEVVIVSGVRTAQGKFSGALKDFSAPQLGGIVIKESIKNAGLKSSNIEEVIMGNVVQAGLGQNVARQAAINASIPYEVGAFHVDKVCGSSLKAVVLAAQAIKSNDVECIVAGGMESMTNCPYVLKKARFGYRMFDGKIIDTMVYDGLWDVYNNFHMGNTGEIIAERNNITREDCDEFAVKSHHKAAKATKNGSFKDEIIKMKIKSKKSRSIIFDKDEGIRENSTVEKLSKLKPFFKENGVVTAEAPSVI